MRAASLASVPLAALLLAAGGAAGGAAWAQDPLPAPLAGEPAAKLPAEAVCAVCAVCGPKEGARPEPVVASLVHNGKTYYFCQDTCKGEFQQDPEKWIKLAQEVSQGREGVSRPKGGEEKAPRHGPGGVGPTGGAGGGSAAPS